MADLDDLTGLLSRAAFFRRMEEAMASSNLHGVPLCLLVADLDFLKSINDHYGHLAGDTALQVVAGALRAILRGDDVGGRYGGDEFVILLSGVSIEGGLAVAERLRAAAGEAAFTPPGSTASLRLSLSIGVAAYPLHGHERERVFAAADRAAYAAKEAGRNTARVASEIIPPPPAASPLSPRLDQSRLVGRHDEIRRLRTGLEAACQGRGGVLIVEGEAGIGKTRLVEEVASLAGMLGMRVLHGYCHQVESELPYHPFLDALVPLIEAATPEMLQQASGLYAGELARLLPAVRQRLPECQPLGVLPPDEDRMRLQQALCHFLTGVARTPVALVLEDIHWADEASTRVLNRLAWQLKDLGMLIVCTVRIEDVPANQPVAAALANLERQGRCERIPLSPLGRAEMSTLLRAAV
ncbi:MAG TPA: diguanylate cyclase, partial [Chloroflexota bacterium]|nr:diguanylate cyclase [Chloroflexota bacterium]